MGNRELDEVFREHEGDDFVQLMERSTTHAGDMPFGVALASVGQWVVILAGSSVIAWLAQ